MASFDRLKAAVEELNRNFPRPGMPPLSLSEIYDLEVDWNTCYPEAKKAGVYILLDADRQVAYVGKASCSHVLGQRLGHYFAYGPDRQGTVIKIDHWKEERLRYIAVIGLEKTHAFEAGAIEEFLIDRLQPRLNKIGRTEVQVTEPSRPPPL